MPKTNYQLLAESMADELIAGGIITADKKAEFLVIWNCFAKGMINYFELKGVPRVDGVDGTISFGGE